MEVTLFRLSFFVTDFKISPVYPKPLFILVALAVFQHSQSETSIFHNQSLKRLSTPSCYLSVIPSDGSFMHLRQSISH